MPDLTYATLDVFTDRRFSGNPLAVVLEADELSTEAMQAIAREFNLSETVFVTRPQNISHTARVRIFTPGQELPFAGHPTVGTAVLLAHLRSPADDHDSIIALEEAVGTVRVGVRLRAGQAPFAEFDAPKLPEDAGPPPPLERLAAAIGLLPSEIGFANHKPCQASAGVPFTFVPVQSLEAIAKAEAHLQHWAVAFGSPKAGKAYLYTRETLHTTASFHARMFAPGAGIVEDPATGAAAAAFAQVLNRFDAPTDGLHKRVIEQGYEMGRPSQIQISLEVERGRLTTVRIGGSAVMVSEGTLKI